MTDDGEVRLALAGRIEARRAAVQAFLRQNRPRSRRRANIAILLSALAAIFTAGPAAGGENFAGSVQTFLGLASDSYVWRTLCLAAMLVSIGSAIVTNLNKSNDITGKLAVAETANAELESLSTQLRFGHLPVDDALKMYQESSVKIPFIEDLRLRPPVPPPPSRLRPPPPGR
jgi:hypothetical protein